MILWKRFEIFKISDTMNLMCKNINFYDLTHQNMRALLSEINHMPIEEKLFYLAWFVAIWWFVLKLIIDSIGKLYI